MIANVKDEVLWRLPMGASSLAFERCTPSNTITMGVVRSFGSISTFHTTAILSGLGVGRRNFSHLPSGYVLGRFLRYTGYYFVYPHAETIVHDEHFTPGDQLLIDQNIHGIPGQLIEFDDVAFGQS